MQSISDNCICGKHLGVRGFCSQKCHDYYYDTFYGDD